MPVIKQSKSAAQTESKAENGLKAPSKTKGMGSLLCNGIDGLYLLWLLFSLSLLGNPEAGLGHFGMWGGAHVGNPVQTALGLPIPAWAPLLATCCLLCCFWALLRFASSLRQGVWPSAFLSISSDSRPSLDKSSGKHSGHSGKGHFFLLCRLCLPASALCFLLKDLQARPVQVQRSAARDASEQAPQSQAFRLFRILQLCSFLALALQLAFLAQLATHYWPSYGQSYGLDAKSSGQNDAAGSQDFQATAYLSGLLGRIDIWFLSIKGIDSGMALLESSSVEIGAVVYGSVSIGKVLVPIRNSLERIGDILFYGRVLLTVMQVVQSLGRYYAPVLLWALLALLFCSYLFSTVSARSFSFLAWLKKCLLLLRAHILFFLFVSFLFEPGLALLDNLVYKIVLQQQYAEFLDSEAVLSDLEQRYGAEDLAANGRWSALIDSAQRWLGNLRSEFAQLGRRLFYFALTAVMRTLVLPLLALWVLFLFYRSTMGNLFKTPLKRLL